MTTPNPSNPHTFRNLTNPLTGVLSHLTHVPLKLSDVLLQYSILDLLSTLLTSTTTNPHLLEDLTPYILSLEFGSLASFLSSPSTPPLIRPFGLTLLSRIYTLSPSCPSYINALLKFSTEISPADDANVIKMAEGIAKVVLKEGGFDRLGNVLSTSDLQPWFYMGDKTSTCKGCLITILTTTLTPSGWRVGLNILGLSNGCEGVEVVGKYVKDPNQGVRISVMKLCTRLIDLGGTGALMENSGFVDWLYSGSGTEVTVEGKECKFGILGGVLEAVGGGMVESVRRGLEGILEGGMEGRRWSENHVAVE